MNGIEAEEWVLAFDSTQHALRMEMLMEYLDLDIDTCPTPTQITAGCALSIQFQPDDLGTVRTLIRSERVEIRGIYYKRDDQYIQLIESAEE
ncbi:hypothetical protein ABD76_11210 [Paenibacillus dendritiformis]|uniref:DUF3343 domain-containing protein n=1 Tax=Paenibacillus dendritiformis TaxID=130049 RepID=UPI0018CD43AD|nr:DUF3343 domain-containing protein [Paenibacillus dendritiformis]MBG9793023.1 hypothetical protein [Paenibacillus dendritiformis]